jgi:chromosome partitioning protein
MPHQRLFWGAALKANGMSTYALWNNKGGVGKSYLTFQIACEYARTHPTKNVLVVDVCPQANASSMLLGGITQGEKALDQLGSGNPRRTISGYIRERIASPYHNPQVGADYLLQVHSVNPEVPTNLFLIPGDEELEILSSRVTHAAAPGPDDAWTKVHLWLSDLIHDVSKRWNVPAITVFIDCNPSFGVYTELAMAAADRLIIPFSADGSSRRAVRSVLALLYGISRTPGRAQYLLLRRQSPYPGQ